MHDKTSTVAPFWPQRRERAASSLQRSVLAYAQNVQCRYCKYKCEWFPKAYELDENELEMMPGDWDCPYGPALPEGGIHA